MKNAPNCAMSWKNTISSWTALASVKQDEPPPVFYYFFLYAMPCSQAAHPVNTGEHPRLSNEEKLRGADAFHPLGLVNAAIRLSPKGASIRAGRGTATLLLRSSKMSQVGWHSAAGRQRERAPLSPIHHTAMQLCCDDITPLSHGGLGGLLAPWHRVKDTGFCPVQFWALPHCWHTHAGGAQGQFHAPEVMQDKGWIFTPHGSSGSIVCFWFWWGAWSRWRQEAKNSYGRDRGKFVVLIHNALQQSLFFPILLDKTIPFTISEHSERPCPLTNTSSSWD